MYPFFEKEQSIGQRNNFQVEQIVTTVIERYIGENPIEEPIARVFDTDGFLQTQDIRYDLNLDPKYPLAKSGDISYLWGSLWSKQPIIKKFAINCYGPIGLYVNDQLVFKSSPIEETNHDIKRDVDIQLEQGWNHFILVAKKVPSGFGALFGTAYFKSSPIHFIIPEQNREGEEGFIYSKLIHYTPKDSLLEDNLSQTIQKHASIHWHFKNEFLENHHNKMPIQAIFQQNMSFGVGHTYITFNDTKDTKLRLSYFDHLQIFVGNSCIFNSNNTAKNQSSDYNANTIDILIKSQKKEDKLWFVSEKRDKQWGFKLISIENGVLKQPFPILGTNDSLIYMSFTHWEQVLKCINMKETPKIWLDNHGIYKYWHISKKGCVIRHYLETENFGKWNYPLGVTLYGFIKAAMYFNHEHILNYVAEHILTTLRYYELGVHEIKDFGATGINNQICHIESLDDCGSFGSVMLEAYKCIPEKFNDYESHVTDLIAESIGHHITNVQSRLPDKTLYRNNTYNSFMDETLWADDLYMSIPFLLRLYLKTEKKDYLSDCIHQIKKYKDYLYLPENKIMSHIFSIRYNTKTEIPWGRGNGWVIFSLIELLCILPNTHETYNELKDFFLELSKGYSKLQDKEGLWHQILTDPTSFQEISCTSMIIYAMAKGVQLGLYDHPEKFIEQARRGIKAITINAIDRQGNVYGVCHGSGFSFSESYYRNELPWIINDNHGIGIVVLAATEVMKMNHIIEQKGVIL